MPNTNAAAAVELADLIYDKRLTRKEVANYLGVTESWLSRRLSNAVGMTIDDYSAIKQATLGLSASLVR